MPFHEGERSEPEWNGMPRSCVENGHASRLSTLLFLALLDPGRRLHFWSFLHRQENEVEPFAQKGVGGVRQFVQPLDGLWPIRSPARAAHALCSKLEPLPERQSRLPARICKDELEHD